MFLKNHLKLFYLQIAFDILFKNSVKSYVKNKNTSAGSMCTFVYNDVTCEVCVFLMFLHTCVMAESFFGSGLWIISAGCTGNDSVQKNFLGFLGQILKYTHHFFHIHWV